MTTPVLFLLGAVALSALGGLVVWVLSRPRPERFGSSIDTFHRDLDALAPPGRAKPSRTLRKPGIPPMKSPAPMRPAVNPPRQTARRPTPKSRANGASPAARNAPAKKKDTAPVNRWGVTQTTPRPRPGPRPKQDG